METKVKEAIDALRDQLDITDTMAASLYLHRATGLNPVVKTPHGPFKLSYDHCVELLTLQYQNMENQIIVRARYQKFIDDFNDVWENPILIY